MITCRILCVELQIHFSLSNPFTIASFFCTKDKPCTELLPNIIYNFTCEDCNVSYIGSTQCSSKCRIDQHLGISSKTGIRLATVMHSLPRIHSETFNYKIHANNFSVMDYSRNIQDLPTLESLYIIKQKLDLNCHLSATPVTYPRNL